MKMLKYTMLSAAAALFAAAVLSCAAAPPSTRPEAGGVQPGTEYPASAGAAVEPVPDASALEGVLRRIAERCGAGDFDGAFALFDTLESEDAEKPDVRLLKASVYLSAGNPGEARAAAAAVSSLSPDNIRALLVLAAVEQSQGRTREQRALLERVLKLEPGNAEALVGMGNLSAAASSFSAAAKFYDQALASEPDNGNALIGRAWAYRNSRDPKKAELLLNRAVERYPGWSAPFHERARLYKSLGFPNEALTDIDQAKFLEKDNYWIAVDRGDILIDLRRKDDALEEFERAKKLNPGYFLAYVYSAGVKDDQGDYDGAEADYAVVTRLNPDYYFAFEGLGMHLMRRSQWDGAKDAFVEAYNRARQDAVTYSLLAAVNWMRAARPAEARPFLAQVLRKAERDTLAWYMLRLYHDQAGDNDIVIRLDKEKNLDTKARMLFYLASYYDIRGNRGLADKYYLQVRDLDRKAIPEWRLNEWTLEARGLALN